MFLCFNRPRYQVSVYRTIGHLVHKIIGLGERISVTGVVV